MKGKNHLRFHQCWLQLTLIQSTKCFWLKNSETQPKLNARPYAYKTSATETPRGQLVQWWSAQQHTSGEDHGRTPMKLMLMSKGKETNLSHVTCSSFITSQSTFLIWRIIQKWTVHFITGLKKIARCFHSLHGLFLLLQWHKCQLKKWCKIYIKWFAQFFGRRRFASIYVSTH